MLLRIQVILCCWEGSCFHSSVAEDSSDIVLLRGQLFPLQCCWGFKWYCVVKRSVVSTAVLLRIQVILCCWEVSCFHCNVAEDSSDIVLLRGQLFPQQCCWGFKWYCVIERAVVPTAVLWRMQVILCCWEVSCFHSCVAEDSSDTVLLRVQLFPQQCCWGFKWYCVVETAVVPTAVLWRIQVILCCWEVSCFHSSVAEDSSDTVLLRGQLFPLQCCWGFKWYCVVERAVVPTAVLQRIRVILCCWEGSCFHSSVVEDSSDTVLLRGQLFPQQFSWGFKWYCVVERAVVSTAVLLKIQVILCCWKGSYNISKDHSAFAFRVKQSKQNRWAEKAGVLYRSGDEVD